MDIGELEARVAKLPGITEWRGIRERKPLRDVNQEQEQSFSALDRVAIAVTDHVGTMGFFLIIATWTVLWLGWNNLAPQELRFDPAPAFVLWLFISNMIQILLMPLIMVGQNLQGRHSELRAEADFEVNQKAEAEVEAILMHLGQQNDLMLEILRRIERLEQTRGALAPSGG